MADPSPPPRILVVDSDPIYRRAVSTALEDAGYRCDSVEASAERLAHYRSTDVDAILLGVRLDLAGMAMLEELGRRAEPTPVLAVGDASHRERILSGLVGRRTRFLSSPFGRQDLEEGLADLLGGSPDSSSGGFGSPSRPEVPLADLVASIRSGRTELPTIAPIAGEIQRLIATPTCGVADVLEVVEKDPVVTASLLRIANSPHYCASVPIRSLRTACLRLGNKRVLALAQEALLQDFFALGKGPIQGVVRSMWQHLVCASHGARAIALHLRVPEPDVLQVAAMLHNLGELVLIQMIAAHNTSTRLWKDPVFLAATGDVIAQHHEEIGGLLLERWSMEAEFVQLARHHHRAPPRGRTTEDSRKRHIVLAGWLGACRAGETWLPGQEEVRAPGTLSALGLSEKDLDAIFEALQEERRESSSS